MDAQHSQRIQDLEQTFKLFNHVSERLEASYHRLGTQVSQLHHQLEHWQDPQRPALALVSNTGDAAAPRRLRAILKALPAGVVVLDGTGRIQDSNPAASELLGEPLLGEVWTDVIQRAFAPRVDDGHEISLRDGRRVSISTCPLGVEPGQVLLLTDVTETRVLQDQLNQHKRLIAMGEMAASLAHQIRTPLASGLLFGSQLKNSRLDDASRQSLTEKIIAQLRHLETLVNDMLMFSRAGYGGREVIDVEELLYRLASGVATLCEQRDITLHVEHRLGTCRILGNSNSLYSALLNLANNAVQAMGQHGQLQLVAREGVCNTVEIAVIDNGPGVPEEIREKLFRPFFTTRTDGTGLGLAVVQAVARAHGGTVRLESRADATTGSEFVVQLPLALQTSTQLEIDGLSV